MTAATLAYLRALPKRPGVKAAQRKERKMAEAQRLPKWAKSPEQRALIAGLYARARELTQQTGESHVVDHLYPLRGRTVCGLHVAENLRVVPYALNEAKGARDPVEFLFT